MDPIVTGALISAGSNLAGSLLQKKGPSSAKQWRNEFDSKMAWGDKYGISKLVMAGVSPSSGPAYGVGGEPGSLGSSLASMGQDVGRAVAARASQPERDLQRLLLEKAGLENEFLRSQIASVNSRTLRESAPALPIPDASGGRLPVAHPNLGQDAENHYSDIGGNILGGAALVNDSDAALTDWFQRTMGFDPRAYTPWSMGAVHGSKFRDAINNLWRLPNNRRGGHSTHYKSR